MFMTNTSINIMSLGGLALGIGMLVDNSIIVLESIFRCREEGDGLAIGLWTRPHTSGPDSSVPLPTSALGDVGIENACNCPLAAQESGESQRRHQHKGYNGGRGPRGTSAAGCRLRNSSIERAARGE